jgi:hypothetical protein
MRSHQLYVVAYVALRICISFSPIPALGQSAPSQVSGSSSIQVDAAPIVTKAKAAFGATAGIGRVTMSGQAHLIEGSLDQMGAITMVAGSDGSFSIAYQIPGGPQAEAQTAFQPEQTCSWTDKKGSNHQIVQPNCMTGVAWFLPTLAMFGGQQSTPVAYSSAGSTLRNGISLLNLRQSSTFSTPTLAPLMAHWSTVDLFLSPDTFLPATSEFSTHPDNNSNIDIPVLISYSDYRQVSGVAVPFHITKSLNGTVVLDVTVSTATLQ